MIICNCRRAETNVSNHLLVGHSLRQLNLSDRDFPLNDRRNPAVLPMFSDRRILVAGSHCPQRVPENTFFSGPLYQLNGYHSRFHKPAMALRPSRFESLPLNRRERRTSDSFANRLGLRVRSLLPQPSRAAFERTFNEVPAGREECGFRADRASKYFARGVRCFGTAWQLPRESLVLHELTVALANGP